MKRQIILSLFIIIFLYGCNLGIEKTYYYVKSIPNYNSQNSSNTPITIIVWEHGIAGPTKKILCVFPPDYKLEGNNDTGWTIADTDGIEVEEIEIREEHEHSSPEEVSHLCYRAIRPA